MLTVDEYLSKIIPEMYEREYDKENDKPLRRNIKMYISHLSNGDYILDDVIDNESHVICEKIMLGKYKEGVLQEGAINRLIHYYIGVIKSNNEFDVDDVPNDDLRDKLLDEVKSISETENETVVIDKNDHNQIKDLIRTHFVFNKNKYVYEYKDNIEEG